MANLHAELKIEGKVEMWGGQADVHTGGEVSWGMKRNTDKTAEYLSDFLADCLGDTVEVTVKVIKKRLKREPTGKMY